MRWIWLHAVAAWLPHEFRLEEFRYYQARTHISGHLPGRDALCTTLGESFSNHDLRTSDVIKTDFFGNMLRLRSAQAAHTLW
ncbi:MAG TPA: hypothetical protein VNF74_05670 [Terriglobales bacterium]|nr:hypothetical protein [Terriglobales bacterium]